VKINPDGSHLLVPHDPKQIYTYVGCKYDPNIDLRDCDRLLECLEPSQREIFLRTAAAALNLKLVRSKLTGRGVKGLLCHGEGSNGKDTLRAVLAAVFGRGMTGGHCRISSPTIWVVSLLWQGLKEASATGLLKTRQK
jgi:putative DNA primase/helicase